MSQLLELPDEVYEAVKRAADASGTSMADLIRQRFGTGNGHTANKIQDSRTEEEKQAARERFESYFGSYDSGDPDSCNNDRIDADLAREYGDNHEPTDR